MNRGDAYRRTIARLGPRFRRVSDWLRSDLRSWLQRTAIRSGRLIYRGVRWGAISLREHPIKIVSTALLGWLLYEVIVPRTIVVLPIAVPKELQERGYTPEVAATRLRDAVNGVVIAANTRMKSPELALNEDFRDFVVPMVGVSIETVASYIRAFLRLDRRRNITGEFTVADHKLWLRLRQNGKMFYEHSEAGNQPNPDELMKKAAMDVVAVTVPYLKAVLASHTDPTAAIDIARRIIADWPETDDNVVWAHNLIGTIYFRQHRLDEAVEEFSEAIRLNDRFATAHNNLGLTLYRQHNVAEAITQYRIAIEYEPDFAYAHHYLANALMELEETEAAKCEYQQALAEFRRAVVSNPRVAVHHLNLAYALRAHPQAINAACGHLRPIAKVWRYLFPAAPRLIDQDTALGQFQEAADFDEHDASAYNGIGLILLEEAKQRSNDPASRKVKTEKAKDAFKKAVVANPYFAEAYKNQAGVLHINGDVESATREYANAIKEYKRLIELEPRDFDSHRNLGRILQILGDTSEAIKAFDNAVGNDRTYYEAIIDRGFAHFDAGNFDDADKDLTTGAALRPTDAYPVLWLHLARQRANRPSPTTELQDVAKRLTRWPLPVVELFLARNGTPDAIIAAANNDPDPDSVCEAQFYAGEWYVLRNMRDQAKASFEEAAKICPRAFIEFAGAQAELSRLAPQSPVAAPPPALPIP
jgi:tetratricopeptide (TPR) repeat protein